MRAPVRHELSIIYEPYGLSGSMGGQHALQFDWAAWAACAAWARGNMESGTVGPHARAIASHAMPDCCEASSSGNTNIIQIAPGTVYIYNPYTCPHTQGGTCSEPTLRVAWAVGQHGLFYKLCYRSHFGPRHNLRLCIPSVRAWGHIVCRSRRWRRRSDGPRGR